ncbi:MAG: CPBP family intramembrane glutamic endopeptidase [Planctomycetota bacterium]
MPVKDDDLRPRLEIGAVLLALVLHYVLTRGLGIRGLDAVPIALAVLVYACWRGRDPAVRSSWGTRRSGFRGCGRDALVLVAVGTAVAAAIGAARGHLAFDGHLLLTMALYPLWGTAQQFLVLALFAHNLDRLGLPRPWVWVLATVGFACAHIPNWQTVAATFVLGGVSTALFFRHRNLWPLGLAHGLLAALHYRWVLGVDVCTAFLTHRG